MPRYSLSCLDFDKHLNHERGWMPRCEHEVEVQRWWPSGTEDPPPLLTWTPACGPLRGCVLPTVSGSVTALDPEAFEEFEQIVPGPPERTVKSLRIFRRGKDLVLDFLITPETAERLPDVVVGREMAICPVMFSQVQRGPHRCDSMRAPNLGPCC